MVIRNTVAVWHTPTPLEKAMPIRAARRLDCSQNAYVRVVGGAHRTTLTLKVSLETGIPPLGLYLNQRAASLLRREDYREKSRVLYHKVMAATKSGNGRNTEHDDILTWWTLAATKKE